MTGTLVDAENLILSWHESLASFVVFITVRFTVVAIGCVCVGFLII